jgi:hypothetical protein
MKTKRQIIIFLAGAIIVIIACVWRERTTSPGGIHTSLLPSRWPG